MTPERSPRLALILSLCLPGLGQFYNREWLKGILFLAGVTLLSNLTLNDIPVDAFLAGEPVGLGRPLLDMGLLTAAALWCGYDAYHSARRKSEATAPIA